MQFSLGATPVRSRANAGSPFPTIPLRPWPRKRRASYATRLAIDFLRRGVAATDANDLRIALARRFIESSRLPDARQVLRDALAKEPTNAAALDLQKQNGP